MACTVAVETAIDAHYARQIEALGDAEPELRATLERVQALATHDMLTGLVNRAHMQELLDQETLRGQRGGAGLECHRTVRSAAHRRALRRPG